MPDANLAIYARHEIHHVVDHLLQGTPNAVANLTRRAIDRILDRMFGRTLDEKITGLEKIVARVETTLQVMAPQLQEALKDAETRRRILTEAEEPATYIFVRKCLEAASQSPDEAKQCAFGDLIAARLVATTESFDELQLRQARRIVNDCSAVHILALARLLIVTNPPFAFEEPIPPPKVKHFFAAVDQATVPRETGYSDMRYLVSLGAITEVQREDINGHASPWMNLFMQWGYGVYDKDVMELENRVQEIAENRGPNGVQYADGIAFGSYALTPPGFAIAIRVASRISGVSIQGL